MMGKQIIAQPAKIFGRSWAGNMTAMGVIGLILAQGACWEGIKPFALPFLALVMVRDKQQGIAVFLGICCGSLPLGYGGELIATILAATAIILLICWRNNFWQQRDEIALLAMVMFCNMIFKGLFYFLPMNYTYSWLEIVVESLLMGIFAALSKDVLASFQGLLNGREDFSPVEEAGILTFLLAVLLGLNDWQIAGLDIQSIASRFLILTAAYWYGSGSGAIIGVLAGIVPSLLGRLTTASMGFYGLAGIFAGSMRFLGKTGVWCAFLAGNLLLMFYFASTEQMIATVAETILAGVIFAFVVYSKEITWQAPVQKPMVKANDEQEKMSRISRIFSGISEELSDDALENQEELLLESLESMYKKVYLQVCSRCDKWQQCWEQDQHNLYQEFSQACDVLEQKGRQENCFSRWFYNRCKRTNELEIALLNQMDILKQKKYYKEQLTQTKETMAKQLAGIGHVVDKLAKEENYAKASEKAIWLMAEKEHLPLEKVRVYTNEQKDWEVSLMFYACLGEQNCQQQLAAKVSKCLKRNYILKQSVCGENDNQSCQLRLVPQKSCQIITGAAQLGKDGSNISGDSWRVIEISAGKTAVILSDGMGSGVEANRQSKTTVNLLERLLAGGATHQLALEIVNAVLLLRSDGENFATVDLTLIDAISQRLEFVKISAAPSFVKRQSMVKMFKSCSLPVGILEEVDIAKQEYPLAMDDLVIMMSDGVFDAINDGETWQEIIKNLPTDDPQMAADYLLALAGSYYTTPVDDMTVTVIKIEQVDCP